MFVSASTGSLSGLSFEEVCQKMADLQFDRIELTLGDASDPSWDVADIAADPESAAQRYRETTRLTICAINVISNISPQLISGISRFAKLLKVTQVTVPSLEIGTPFNDETDRLKKMVADSSQEGIRLSLKTQIGRLTEDPHTAVELCQAVKGLGLTLDPSHFIAGPHKNRSFDMVYPYVSHVQLRDTTPEQLQISVGLGEVDYARIISQLQREEYDRALSVDIDPTGLKPDDLALEMRKLRMLLESLL